LSLGLAVSKTRYSLSAKSALSRDSMHLICSLLLIQLLLLPYVVFFIPVEAQTVSASIVDFSPATGTYSPGQGVTSRLTFRNTGTTDWTFYVGYSVQDRNGRWYDITSHAVRVSRGQSSGWVSKTWTVPSSPVEGPYKVAMAVWRTSPDLDSRAQRLDYRERANSFQIVSRSGPTTTRVYLYIEVLDDSSGSRISGASVYWDGSYVGVTGSDGRLRVDTVYPPASHSYRVTASGYNERSGSMSIGASSGGGFTVRLTRSGPTIPVPPTPLSPSGTLTASGTSMSVSFSWGSVSGVSEYQVQVTLGGSVVVDATTSSTSISRTLNLGSYSWRVRARNAAGWGSWSSSLSFSIQQRATTPPPSPSDLLATALSESRIRLTWKYALSDVDDFHIERRKATTENWVEIGRVLSTAREYTDTSLDRQTTYYYRIRAHRHNDGAYSDYSNVAFAATEGLSRIQIELADLLAGKLLEVVGALAGAPLYTIAKISQFSAGFITSQFPVDIHLDDYAYALTAEDPLYVLPGRLPARIDISVNTYRWSGNLYLAIEQRDGSAWKQVYLIVIRGLSSGETYGFSFDDFKLSGVASYRIRSYYGDNEGKQYGYDHMNIVYIRTTDRPPLQIFFPATVSYGGVVQDQWRVTLEGQGKIMTEWKGPGSRWTISDLAAGDYTITVYKYFGTYKAYQKTIRYPDAYIVWIDLVHL